MVLNFIHVNEIHTMDGMLISDDANNGPQLVFNICFVYFGHETWSKPTNYIK